jgi:hypothetical protein
MYLFIRLVYISVYTLFTFMYIVMYLLIDKQGDSLLIYPYQPILIFHLDQALDIS